MGVACCGARRSAFVFTATLVFVVGACEHGGAEGMEQTDADTGPRLVVLSPGLASVLRALGRAEVLVGRHRYDAWSDQSVPAVGDNVRVEAERLMAVRPTHIVLEQSETEQPTGVAIAAERTGAAVIRVPVLQLADLEEAVRTVDRLSRGLSVGSARDGPSSGLSVEAQALLTRLGRATARSPVVEQELGRTLVIAATDPIGVTGPGSFHHDLVLALGAEALPATGGPWQSLSSEDVAALRPRTLVLLAPGEPTADASSRLRGVRSLLPDLFVEGRIVVVSGDEALLPGPGLIDVAEAIRTHALGRASPGE